jgi:uncharacterized RDD family membrane protein YckC
MTQGPDTPAMGVPPEGPRVPASTASLGVRIGARLLDTLLIGIPALILFGILGLGTGLGGDGWLAGAIFSLLWFGYFVWFESNSGATVGKRLLNLRVVVADGSHPSLEVAAKRNVWMLFGLIPLIGTLLSFVALIAIMITISTNADSRGMHDTFAGTAVMR